MSSSSEKLLQDFKGFKGIIKAGPYLYPSGYNKFNDKIRNFKTRAGDTVIVTWPKCGTTWLQEIVWTMRHNRDLNNKDALIPINARCPFLDMDMFEVPIPDEKDHPLMKAFLELCPTKDPKEGFFIQQLEAMTGIRTIKTHLPFSQCPKDMLKNSKVIYCYRDPRDVCSSYLHHSRCFKSYSYVGDDHKYVDYFVNDNVLYAPYHLHVKEALAEVKNPNLLIMTYEELKTDVMKQLKRLDTFLKTDLSKEQLEKIKEYTSFTKMRERDNVFSSADLKSEFYNKVVVDKEGGFFRKGVSGGWKSQFDESDQEKLICWMKKHFLPVTDVYKV